MNEVLDVLTSSYVDGDSEETRSLSERFKSTNSAVEFHDKLKLAVDNMTVSHMGPLPHHDMPCTCSLASSDMSISLPNLTASFEAVDNVVFTGSSNDIRTCLNLNKSNLTIGNYLNRKLQFKTSSLEDCQACKQNEQTDMHSKKSVENNSNSSLSKANGIGQFQEIQEELVINPNHQSLSAVLENISLVYLPNTKQLVKPEDNRITDCSNNNEKRKCFQFCSEGLEDSVSNCTTGKTALTPSVVSQFTADPSLSPRSLHKICIPTLQDPAVLSQESDVSSLSHSTVILCNHGDEDHSQGISQDLCIPDLTDRLPHVVSDYQANSLSCTNASSFSSISSLSTSTELSLSVASCSDLDSQDQVIVDSEEAGFVEINLDSRSINERKLSPRVSGQESSAPDVKPSPFTLHHTVFPNSGAKPKKKSLTSFLTRSIFSRKAKEASSDNAQGWRLFGKVPPKSPTPREDTEDILEEKAVASIGPYRVKKTDVEAPSTTALILEQRPRGLPNKDPEEEERHRQQYEAMVEAARKKELREAKQRKKQLQQQLKHEDALSRAVKIWNTDILPNWETARSTKRVRDMWWSGIPPCVRGRVWKLAFGNDLNLTPELYEICLSRAKDRLKIMKEAGSDTDSISSFSDLPASKEASVELIKLDVSRTFPQLCIFQKGGPYHELLQGLLGAYACYRPDVGYVQGMSFIAAVLLLNMDVADAFICFANLLNRPCQIAFFRLDEGLMNGYFETYKLFFEENLPKLFSYFKKINLASNLYIIDWLFTLYAKSLPLDVASRIWDVFSRDGEEFLFRTALGILKLHEDILLSMDFIHLAQFLTRLPESINSDDLFQAVDSINMSIDKRKFMTVLSEYREQNKPES